VLPAKKVAEERFKHKIKIKANYKGVLNEYKDLNHIDGIGISFVGFGLGM
jgi:hypothetical protein